MGRISLYLIIFLAGVIPAAGQSACELTLTKAQEEFDAGRFHGVPAILEECLKKNQNREWAQRAYLLLAGTYLLLGNPEMADQSYLNVLKANPEYITDESRDPIDLVYLSKKFTAEPIFSLNAKVGLNTSFMRVIHDVDISSQAMDLGGNELLKPAQEDYSLQVGWQGGLGVDYHYDTRFSLGAEVVYSFTSFSHNSKNLFKQGGYSVAFTDKQTWIGIPITARYTHGTKPLRPYAFAGYSVNLLLRDRAAIVIDGDNESEDFNYKYKRNNFATSMLLGVGLKYKWGLRYIFGQVRYSFGLTNLTNARSRFDEFDGINQEWTYVDDDFRMDNLYVSIGYIHPFYKPRELRNARTKSVLRKIRKR